MIDDSRTIDSGLQRLTLWLYDSNIDVGHILTLITLSYSYLLSLKVVFERVNLIKGDSVTITSPFLNNYYLFLPYDMIL